MSIIRRHPSVKVTSAGGVEDPAHPGSLTNQDIVFGHSLLCLQNSDGDAPLFQEVQRGGLHLGERNTYTFRVSGVTVSQEVGCLATGWLLVQSPRSVEVSLSKTPPNPNCS